MVSATTTHSPPSSEGTINEGRSEHTLHKQVKLHNKAAINTGISGNPGNSQQLPKKCAKHSVYTREENKVRNNLNEAQKELNIHQNNPSISQRIHEHSVALVRCTGCNKLALKRREGDSGVHTPIECIECGTLTQEQQATTRNHIHTIVKAIFQPDQHQTTVIPPKKRENRASGDRTTEA